MMTMNQLGHGHGQPIKPQRVPDNACGKCQFAKALDPPNAFNPFGPGARSCKNKPPQVTSFIIQQQPPAKEEGKPPPPPMVTFVTHTAYPIVGAQQEGCADFKLRFLTTRDAPDIAAALSRSGVEANSP
jgi:hypothetical protein